MLSPSQLTQKWAPGLAGDYEEPYENYAFYSLYGWRVHPPIGYPQNTFNTPFDLKSRECGLMCHNSDNHSDCLEKCQLNAVKYTVSKSSSHQDKIRCLHDPSNKKSYISGDDSNSEKFSYVTRTLPSHTSTRFRSYPPGHHLTSFCFYR